MTETQIRRPLLFTPIALRSVVARHRIVASPMCQYVSGSALSIPFGPDREVAYSWSAQCADPRSARA